MGLLPSAGSRGLEVPSQKGALDRLPSEPVSELPLVPQVLLLGVQRFSPLLADGEAISQAWISSPPDPQLLPNCDCAESDGGRRQGLAGGADAVSGSRPAFSHGVMTLHSRVYAIIVYSVVRIMLFVSFV